MRIVVAPDSFKGSLPANAVAEAMADGIHAVFPHAEVIRIPIADGGEGTVQALVEATGGALVHEEVVGPLGRPVDAVWGLLEDGAAAVVEMAAASGLALVPQELRDPRITTTFGTGQLIRAALDRGVRRLIVGLGGSATNDGGTGMAAALGARFLDARGAPLPPGGAALAGLARIDLTGLDPRLAEAEIRVACDVDNPLCGPRGASAVYGPQKGATPQMVDELDQALAVFADIARRETGRDVAGRPGAGAAGGLGAGLMLFTRSEFSPGIAIVLEAAGFAERVRHADLVLTGEGCTDFQTTHGKAPVGVAALAKQHDIPVVCLSGGLGAGHEAVLGHGIDGIMSIVPRPMDLETCMQSAPELIRGATSRLCQAIRVGMALGPGERSG